jgi:hypothetical protein
LEISNAKNDLFLFESGKPVIHEHLLGKIRKVKAVSPSPFYDGHITRHCLSSLPAGRQAFTALFIEIYL